MGKKKNKNNHEDQDHNHEGEKEVIQKKEAGDGGAKKDGGKNPPTTVFKVEMHCEGCASKIIKMARRLEGVESVKADTTASKLTVIGKVDPSQIREILHQKTKKKVDIISPQPKKEDSNNKNNRDDNKKSSEKKPDAENKKPDADNKKPKEAPVTAAVIKVAFHCLGCIEKIHKIVIKTKGVQEMTLDKQKETVTVKGTMDVKALTEDLKKRLKRPVEIVPPKKEKDAGGGGDKDGKNAGGGNSGQKKNKGGDSQDNASGGDKDCKNAGGGNSGQKKNKGGDIQDNAGGGNATAKMEVSKMEYAMQPGFGYGPGPAVGQLVPVYWNGYMGQPVHVPVPMSMPVHEYGYEAGQVSGNSVYMKFNDENSDACLVM